MAVAVFDAGGGSSRGGTTLTFTTTAAIPAGSLIIGYVQSNSTNTGFSVGGQGLGTSVFSLGSATAFYVIASGNYASGSTVTVNVTSGTGIIAATVFYVTGFDPNNPIDTASVRSANGSGTTPSATMAAAPVVANSLVLGFLGTTGPVTDAFTQDTGDGFAAPPSRYGTSGGPTDQTIAGGAVISSAALTYNPTIDNRAWVCAAFAIRAAPAQASVQVGSGQAKTASLSFVTSGPIPAGTFVLVCFAATSNTAPTVTVGGVSMQQRIAGSGASGLFAFVYGNPVATAIAQGATVAVTTSGSAVAASVIYVTNVDATTPIEFSQNAAGTTTAVSVTPSGGPTVISSVNYAVVAVLGPSGDTYTQPGSFAAIPARIGTTGGGATSNVTINGGTQLQGSRVGYSPTLGTARTWNGLACFVRQAALGPPTGTLALTQAAQTLSATGWSTAVGTLTATQANHTISAQARSIVGGALARLEVNDTFAGTGGPRVAGTLAVTEISDTFAGTGGPQVGGTLATTQADQTLTAGGTVAGAAATPITHVQGNSSNSGSNTVSSLSTSFATPVALGNMVVAYFGLYGVSGTVTDDKGNVYTALPLDNFGGPYGVQIAYCINVTNGPTTITLNLSPAGGYSFLIVDEFSKVSTFDQTTENTYGFAVASFPSGSVTPASNGELLYTIGWSEDTGPLTVNSPFTFLQDGSTGFSNVANAFYVQPTAASIGATWVPPSAQRGLVRLAAFKAADTAVPVTGNLGGGVALPANTVLLLHADGANGSTTFIDSSPSAHTLTAISPAQVSAVGAYFGTGGLDTSASGGFGTAGVNTNNVTDFNFGAGQFTIEAWCYVTVPFGNNNYGIVAQWGGGGNQGCYFNVSPNAVRFVYSTNGSNAFTTFCSYTFPLNTWVHVAVDRDAANNIRIYVNGAVQSTTAAAATIFPSTVNALIGNDLFNESFGGYLDEVLVTKGSSRGGAFTPPTAHYGSGITQDSQTLAAAGTVGAAGITGTLTQPQAPHTLASVGTVRVAGTLTQPQAAHTIVAAGGPRVGGTLSASQAAHTVASTGTVAIAGTLAVTEALDTINAFASVGFPPVTGTLVVTEALDTLAAAGTPTVGGTLTAGQAAHTLAAVGRVGVGGTLTQPQAANGLVAAATVGVSGNLAQTQAAQTFVAAGAVTVGGALTATEAVDTITAAGGPRTTGTLTQPQAAHTLAAAGSVLSGIGGALNATQAPQTLAGAAVGAPITIGTLNLTQAAHGLVAAGGAYVSGHLAVTLVPDTLAASGFGWASGTLAATQADQWLATAVRITVGGALVATQAGQTIAALAYGAALGSLATTQANQTGAAHGTVSIGAVLGLIQASQIVTAQGGVSIAGGLTVTEATDRIAASGINGTVVQARVLMMA